MSSPVNPVCATGSAFEPVEVVIVAPRSSSASIYGAGLTPELVTCIHLQLFDAISASLKAAWSCVVEADVAVEERAVDAVAVGLREPRARRLRAAS